MQKNYFLILLGQNQLVSANICIMSQFAAKEKACVTFRCPPDASLQVLPRTLNCLLMQVCRSYLESRIVNVVMARMHCIEGPLMHTPKLALRVGDSTGNQTTKDRISVGQNIVGGQK